MVDRLLLGYYAPAELPDFGGPDCAAAPVAAEGTKRRITVYDTEQQRSERYRQAVSADLRTALLEGELTMAFQPVVDAASGRLVQAEGLARWTHAEHGPIAPDLFVVLAEDAGLMPALTQWALDTAIAACAAWQHSKPGVGVAVNLSATDLQSVEFPHLVLSLLGRHGLPASLLALELTETTLMTDVDSALEVLGTLSKIGMSIAIDDFGTGFCSLSYLRHLPVDFIKIDRSFITAMLDHAEDDAIVSMVISLAHTLGLSTVAEGVQDRPTGARLVEFGVDLLQGAAIGAPMPAEAFSAWNPGPHHIRTVHSVAHLRAEHADVDALTGLADRQAAIRALSRMSSSDAVIRIGLGDCKRINDTFGEMAGLGVLHSFASTLRCMSREADTIARLRDVEFVWLLPGTSPEKAVDALQRLRSRWESTRSGSTMFSAGVTRVGDAGPEAALALANEALLSAQRAARSSVRVS